MQFKLIKKYLLFVIVVGLRPFLIAQYASSVMQAQNFFTQLEISKKLTINYGPLGQHELL
jgi:hypothetical protein